MILMTQAKPYILLLESWSKEQETVTRAQQKQNSRLGMSSTLRGAVDDVSEMRLPLNQRRSPPGALGFVSFGSALGTRPFPLGEEMERDCHFGMGVEGCTDGGLSEGVFYDRGPSLSITVAPNFPVEPGPNVVLHADLVFRGVLREGTFAPATPPSGVSYPPGMGRLRGGNSWGSTSLTCS